MAESRTNVASETLLDLPATGPMHARLSTALRAAIRSGRISTGSVLPPSRALAADLGCSRWVVTQAYAQLATEGYLIGRTGSATRVRWSPGPPMAQGTPAGPAPGPRYDLVPGLPDLRAFPRRRWAEAIRSALADAPHADLGYPPPGGHARLRAVLAEHLTRARGAVVTPEAVTVCTGISDGVERLCRALITAGHTTIAVEDPGWGRMRVIAEAAGLRVEPVPIDGDGLRVDRLPAGVRAAIVSPAHQFPTGIVLAPARRAALVEWARTVDGVLFEDDYDAEFRYDRRPVGTLQGLDPGRVVLLGSVSKTLAPGLRIGWAVAPPRWRQALKVAAAPPTLDQLGFAAFVGTGAYDRHLHGCRQRYRARRDALVAALGRHLPDARISGVAAGLHLLLDLPGVDTADVVRRAAAGGVAVSDLAWYRVAPGSPGLVLGYGNLADAAVEPAIAGLAAAVGSSTGWIETGTS